MITSLNYSSLLSTLKKDRDFTKLVRRTIQRFNPQIEENSLDEVVKLSVSDTNPFIKTLIEKLVISEENTLHFSTDELKAQMQLLNNVLDNVDLELVKQNFEVSPAQPQSPRFCLDNIIRLVNSEPDIFSYPLLGTFSTSKGSPSIQNEGVSPSVKIHRNQLYSPGTPKSVSMKSIGVQAQLSEGFTLERSEEEKFGTTGDEGGEGSAFVATCAPSFGGLDMGDQILGGQCFLNTGPSGSCGKSKTLFTYTPRKII